jgi:predicted acylesterase/phospholipase RssA
MAGGRRDFTRLGALKEIEGLVGCLLCEKFDLIYGTSTGAIIAALLGLGKSVDEIEALYRKHVVTVMARWLPRTDGERRRKAEDRKAEQTYTGHVRTRLSRADRRSVAGLLVVLRPLTR